MKKKLVLILFFFENRKERTEKRALKRQRRVFILRWMDCWSNSSICFHRAAFSGSRRRVCSWSRLLRLPSPAVNQTFGESEVSPCCACCEPVKRQKNKWRCEGREGSFESTSSRITDDGGAGKLIIKMKSKKGFMKFPWKLYESLFQITSRSRIKTL